MHGSYRKPMTHSIHLLCKQWNRLLEQNIGLDYWTELFPFLDKFLSLLLEIRSQHSFKLTSNWLLCMFAIKIVVYCSVFSNAFININLHYSQSCTCIYQTSQLKSFTGLVQAKSSIVSYNTIVTVTCVVQIQSNSLPKGQRHGSYIG